MNINLNLNEEEINKILEALSLLSYREVFEIINNIIQQSNEQVEK